MRDNEQRDGALQQDSNTLPSGRYLQEQQNKRQAVGGEHLNTTAELQVLHGPHSAYRIGPRKF